MVVAREESAGSEYCRPTKSLLSRNNVVEVTPMNEKSRQNHESAGNQARGEHYVSNPMNVLVT